MPYTGECGYYFPKLDHASLGSGAESLPSRRRPITPPCLLRQSSRSSSRRMRSPPPPKHMRHLLTHNDRARESVRATLRELQLKREQATDAQGIYFNEDERSLQPSRRPMRYEGGSSLQTQRQFEDDHFGASVENRPNDESPARYRSRSLRFGTVLTYGPDEYYGCRTRESSSDECDGDELPTQSERYVASRHIPPPPCRREKYYTSEPSDDELDCTN